MAKDYRLKANEDVCDKCPGVMELIEKDHVDISSEKRFNVWKCRDCGTLEYVER